MYQIRTTPGFIIDSRSSGEAGKVLSIFTRDLGLVLATAQGIRYEKSKLRYHAQDYSLGTFSFVKGKEFWRLTSADKEKALRSPMMMRIASLLKRLLHGEEPHPELYECVSSCALFLAENDQAETDDLETLESLTVLRILNSLGYVGNHADFNGYLRPASIDAALLKGAGSKRSLMNRHINKALKESHL